jgi:hypothetical protein
MSPRISLIILTFSLEGNLKYCGKVATETPYTTRGFDFRRRIAEIEKVYT